MNTGNQFELLNFTMINTILGITNAIFLTNVLDVQVLDCQFISINVDNSGVTYDNTMGLFYSESTDSLLIDNLTIRESWYYSDDYYSFLLFTSRLEIRDILDLLTISNCIFINNTMTSTQRLDTDQLPQPTFFIESMTQAFINLTNNIFQVGFLRLVITFRK